MTNIDHAATALACLNIPGVLVREDDASPAGDRMIQEAQVHATLALVEQQKRVADWLERWPIAGDMSPVVSVNA